MALLGWFGVGIRPQESIVVAIRRGHDILLRMKAYAHLAQIVGEDRRDFTERGVVVERGGA